MTPPRRKVTLVMEDTVFYGIQRAVESGAAKSQSALVQEAVIQYLNAAQQRELARAYVEAAADPLFLADIAQVNDDFEAADADVGEP